MNVHTISIIIFTHNYFIIDGKFQPNESPTSIA